MTTKKQRIPKKRAPKKDLAEKHVLPRISLEHLGRIFQCDAKNLRFAIAETADDDGGFSSAPVVVIANSDYYIDLVTGNKVKTAYAFNAKQNFFAAVTSFDGGEFSFSAPLAGARVKKEVLEANFGSGIVF